MHITAALFKRMHMQRAVNFWEKKARSVIRTKYFTAWRRNLIIFDSEKQKGYKKDQITCKQVP